jgi:hypothetical protein
MINKKLLELEKRVNALERTSRKVVKTGSSRVKLDALTVDLDNLMQKHSERFKNGILFSGLAIPSDNPTRLVRWSCSGGFKNDKEFDQFIELARSEDISRFCSNFSSPEKLKIIRAMIKEGSLTQKEVLERTDLTQGQFYHHIKELVGSKLIEKLKQDKYDLSPMGHVLATSFIGIINTFLK